MPAQFSVMCSIAMRRVAEASCAITSCRNSRHSSPTAWKESRMLLPDPTDEITDQEWLGNALGVLIALREAA